ncbi:MAG: DUF4959 domain-containing protein [Bacteroidales bacterium]|nr:DUF4959 domain-containing protein [Bacteroidales bacterium]
MKKTVLNTAIILALALMWQCKEPQNWQDPTDPNPPGGLSNVSVKNINGGAWIHYTLPNDSDILGVRAEYSFDEGKTMEAFASAFNDSILIQGAPDTQERTVKLYVMDKSRNESAVVEKTIQPLTPPVEIVRRSLAVTPTFGGIYAVWENVMEEDIAISVLVKDSIGEWVLYDTYYTKTVNGKTSFRGFQNVAQNFRFEIRDKWRHYATPMDTVLTPLFEEEIIGRDPKTDADIWMQYSVPDHIYRGDWVGLVSGNAFRNLHDGRPATDWNSGVENMLIYFTGNPEHNFYMLPQYFSIDMGRKAAYSRLRLWMRERNPIFSAWQFVDFEIWATNNPKATSTVGNGSKADNLKYWTPWPEVDGTDQWKNDWVKLADCAIRLPSGATSSNDPITQEDRDFITAGFEFETDPAYSNQSFRYIRFVCKKWNNPQPYIQFGELKFWGAYDE